MVQHRYAAVCDRLQNVRQHGRYWMARCPAHEDNRSSLSLSIGDDGRLLMKCHAGCEFETIRRALNLDYQAFFAEEDRAMSKPTIEAVYDYRDENGTLLFQTVRLKPKDFRQRRPDGHGGWDWTLGDVRRVLFGLPEILAASPTRAVFVVEGETDVLTARKLGLVATTNPMGAGKWSDAYSQTLIHRPCVVIPDNDDPGRKHADEVAKSLAKIAKSVRIVTLPGDVKDLTAWVDAGGTMEQLKKLVNAKTAPSPIDVAKLRETVNRIDRLWDELRGLIG